MEERVQVDKAGIKQGQVLKSPETLGHVTHAAVGG